MSIAATLLFLNFILITSSLLSWRRYRDITNPVIVFSVPILLQYWIYYLSLSKMYPISDKTNIMYSICALAFVFGCLWAQMAPQRKSSLQAEERSTAKALNHFDKVTTVFIFLGFAGMFLGLRYAMRNGLSGPYDLFNNLRYASSVTAASQGIFPYLILLLQAAALFMILDRDESGKLRRRYLTLFLIALVCFSALFTMARTSLLTTFASCLGVYLLSNRYVFKTGKLNMKVVVGVVGLFIIGSWFIAEATNKNNYATGNFLTMYIGYPLVAFDHWISNTSINTGGSQTLAFLYKILESAGLRNTVPLDLGMTRADFNVFTYMKAPFMDFGKYGMYGLVLLLGLFYGIIYRKAAKGSPYGVVLYSIFLYPLIMVFFDYQFNLSSLIYFMLILLFVYVFGEITSNSVNGERVVRNKRKIKNPATGYLLASLGFSVIGVFVLLVGVLYIL